MTQVLCVGPLMPQLMADLESRFGAASLEDLTQQSWESVCAQFGTMDKWLFTIEGVVGF